VASALDGGYVLLCRSNPPVGGEDSQIDILKVDSTGNPEWKASFGTENYESGYDLCTAPNGGFIAVGSTVDIGTYNNDIYAVRFNDQGNVLWEQTYDRGGDEFGYAVCPTDDDGFLIGGMMANDMAILKIDDQGDTLWCQTYIGVDWDACQSVEQADDRGFILGGFTWSVGGGAWPFAAAVKTDSLGNIEWDYIVDMEGGGDYLVVEAKCCPDGGFVLAYTVNLSLSGAYHDFRLQKLSQDGMLQWDHHYGGHGGEEFNSLYVASDGGYLLGGWTTSFGAAMHDFYVLKIDSEGDVDWYYHAGGSYDDEVNDCLQNTTGQYVIAGLSNFVNNNNDDIALFCLEEADTELDCISKIQVGDNFRITPNPFNPVTTIRFDLDRAKEIDVTVYDMAGRIVQQLVNGWQDAGSHEVTFHGEGLSSGIYLCRISTKESHVTEKLVLIK